MLLYVVTNDGSYNNIYVVKAENKKDAIEKVFKKHFEWQNEDVTNKGCTPFTRTYFKAQRLDRMFENDIVELN